MDLPSAYPEIFQRMLGYDALRAVMELRAHGWEHIYGSQGTLSWVVGDPTGQWVIKADTQRDPGYEAFASMLASTPDLGALRTQHVPRIALHGQIMAHPFKGSLTLMERLRSLGGPSQLTRRRHALIAAAKVQEAHLTGNGPQEGGSKPAIARVLDTEDADMVNLAAVLGSVMAISHTDLDSNWTNYDVMMRADGTEVLLDPFLRVPREFHTARPKAA